MIQLMNALLNYEHSTTNFTCECGSKVTFIRWEGELTKAGDWSPPARWTAVSRDDGSYCQILLSATTRRNLIKALKTEHYLIVDESSAS